MSIKSILASVFALALVVGFGISQTASNVSFIPAAHASPPSVGDDGSSDDGSSDDGSSDDNSNDDPAAGSACNCGVLTGIWVAGDDNSSDDGSSDDNSSDDGSSDDNSSDDGSNDDGGFCQCSGAGTTPVGAPVPVFQPF